MYVIKEPKKWLFRKGYFVIDGIKEKCEVGDLVIIQAGKKFTYQGKLKMMATSTPPWKAEQEKTL